MVSRRAQALDRVVAVHIGHLNVHQNDIKVGMQGLFDTLLPIVGDFDLHLGTPSVMMGFGLPDDCIHAPNERFLLKNFALGIESVIRFFEEAAQ